MIWTACYTIEDTPLMIMIYLCKAGFPCPSFLGVQSCIVFGPSVDKSPSL